MVVSERMKVAWLDDCATACTGPKKIPETTAFAGALLLMTTTLTLPETFHTAQMPPWNAARLRESSSASVAASRISIVSVRPW